MSPKTYQRKSFFFCDELTTEKNVITTRPKSQRVPGFYGVPLRPLDLHLGSHRTVDTSYMQHQLPCIVVIYWISACILGVCWWGEEKFKIQEPESPRILWGPSETPWFAQGFPPDRRHFVYTTSATLYYSHLLNNWLHWGFADGVR